MDDVPPPVDTIKSICPDHSCLHFGYKKSGEKKAACPVSPMPELTRRNEKGGDTYKLTVGVRGHQHVIFCTCTLSYPLEVGRKREQARNF